MTATKIIATDSEWDNGQWISTAFASDSGVTVFMRDDVPADVRLKLEITAATLAVRLIFTKRDDHTNLLRLVCDEPCRLALYFSPKDIEYAVGCMGQQFFLLGEAAEIELEHLEGPLGWLFAAPQRNQTA